MTAYGKRWKNWDSLNEDYDLYDYVDNIDNERKTAEFHIAGFNKERERISNLEKKVIPPEALIEDEWEGNMSYARKTAIEDRKVIEANLIEIIKMRKSGYTVKEIANEFCVGFKTLWSELRTRCPKQKGIVCR